MDSIPSAARGVPIVINIVCDHDEQTFQFLANNLKKYSFGLNIFNMAKQKGAVYCRNMVIQNTHDGVLYATDDMTFDPGSIRQAFRSFNHRFKDDDGVVGFVQIPNSFNETGVALVGKKFLDRYEKRQLFNPQYFHFACQEVHWLAKHVGKFYQDKKAIIFHYHPVFFRKEMDQTHIEARKHKAKDMALIRERAKRGEIWALC